MSTHSAWRRRPTVGRVTEPHRTADTVAPEGVRQRNLARLLRLVHVEGPLSRAALTESTGLNRSTIADLVGELVRAGLVEERSPDPSRRVGRPSPVVAVSPDVVAIAANPEVDAIDIAAIGLDQRIHARIRMTVDELLSPQRVAELVAAQVREWEAAELADRRIVAVGLAVPGLVRSSDGMVRNAPHLRWRDEPVRDVVEQAIGLPVVVGNDANLGAIAEHLYGAARGIDDVVYLNGGASGIGGGLIVHGRPVGGSGGYAGEFGQNRPGIASAADRLAGDGVLEDEVSRARLIAVVGQGPLDDEALGVALGSPSAPDIAEETARQRRILATALANAVNVLNPAVIVLGGFLATLAEVDADELAASVRRHAMSANGEDVVVRSAVLAQDRLLIGAAEAAFGPLLSEPDATAWGKD